MAGGRGAQMCSSTALGAHTSSASMSEEEKVAPSPTLPSLTLNVPRKERSESLSAPVGHVTSSESRGRETLL